VVATNIFAALAESTTVPPELIFSPPTPKFDARSRRRFF
jgi:hypothetical protein